MNTVKFSKLTIFLSILFFSNGLAQHQESSIKGYVYNSELITQAGVKVQLQNIEEYYITNTDGYFEFNNLKPGFYSLELHHVGYESIVLDNINLEVGRTVLLDSIILTDRVYIGDEIVVSASKVKQSISEISANINIVTKSEIQKLNSKSSAEVLREEPGLSVQKTNHSGGSVNIRGLSSNQVLILVDGIRLNNSTYRLGNHQYVTTVDNSMLNQIEVIKGPMSVLYGSDAMGGTISLFSRNMDNLSDHNNYKYNLKSRFSSADNEKYLSGSFAFKLNKIKLSIGSSYKDIDDLKRGGNSNYYKLEKSTNDLLQSPSGYSTHDIDSKLNYVINDKQNLSLAYQYSRQFDVPRYDKYENDDYYKWLYKNQKRDLIYLKYENEIDYNFLKYFNATVSFQKQQEEREIQKDIVLSRTNEIDKVGTIGFTFTTKSELYQNQIISGFDYYIDKVNSYRNIYSPTTMLSQKDFTGRFPDNADYASLGLFVKDQFDISSNITAAAGLRYSLVETSFKYKTELSSENYNNTFKAVTGSLGLLYNLSKYIVVKSNLGQAFRAPNLSDLSKFGESKGNIYEIPNLQLNPEKLNSIDIGLNLNFSSYKTSFTYFYSHISNIIESSNDLFNGQEDIELNGISYKIKSKQNVGSAYIRGLEMTSRISLRNTFYFYGNVTYTHGQKLNVNEPVGGIPPLSGNIGIVYDSKDIYIQFYSRFADKQERLSFDDLDDPRIPSGGTPSWFTANFRSQFELTNYLDLYFSLENIFDLNYREHGSGINGPGRNFVIGLNIGNY